VARSGTDFRYFPNLGDGGWQPSRSLGFTNSAGFGFEDANARLLDFDGYCLPQLDLVVSSSG
jgi:hypothetical protein